MRCDGVCEIVYCRQTGAVQQSAAAAVVADGGDKGQAGVDEGCKFTAHSEHHGQGFCIEVLDCMAGQGGSMRR